MRQVSEKLWIARQPGDAEFKEARARGIAAIVNNRPDGEDSGQPTAAQSSAAAAKHGLGYVHIPVVSESIDKDTVRRFQAALSEADGPVLAHCRTGTRSLTLWTIGEVLDGRMSSHEIDALGARMGLDLKGAKAWLQKNM